MGLSVDFGFCILRLDLEDFNFGLGVYNCRLEV